MFSAKTTIEQIAHIQKYFSNIKEPQDSSLLLIMKLFISSPVKHPVKRALAKFVNFKLYYN